jgi:hypothetical protein
MASVPLAGDGDACRWCGEDHGKRCPWVKAFEFSSGDDRVTRVEFLTPADFGPQRQEPAAEEPATYDKLKPMSGG